MSASSSSNNEPSQMPRCRHCVMYLLYKKDLNGDVILRNEKGKDVPIFYCRCCRVEFPPNKTWEQKMFERGIDGKQQEEILEKIMYDNMVAATKQEERARLVTYNQLVTDPETIVNCPNPDCTSNRATYKTFFDGEKGEDWYVYTCCACKQTFRD